MIYELTILMPCLNEERSMEFCILEARKFIEKSHVAAEILIADNGSTDRSVEIAQACGARVVRVSERGYGAALLGGIYAAKGKYIIMGDCDGSYDFCDLWKFMEKLRGGYDLVVGNRFRGGIMKKAMPFLHRIGVPLLSIAARLVSGARVWDFHCGIRGFDAEKARALGLSCTGMEFATEIICKFAKSGARMCEVPALLRRDIRDRAPHLRTFRDGWRHLKYILSVALEK